MPGSVGRPLVPTAESALIDTLRRQMEQVARMTRGEPHRLATVVEAFDVQQVVEAILSGRPMTGVAEGG